MSSLKADIAALRQELGHGMQADVRAIFERATQRLVDSGIAEQAVTVGDHFPAFSLPNAGGIAIDSEDLLAQGPLIISFYRGGWCPYCSLELRAYQQLLPRIKELGANLVAISPQLPDESLTMAAKSGLAFEVLTDTGNSLADHLGLAFDLPEAIVDLYRSMGFDLERINGVMRWSLPIPATYVVDSSSKIVAAHINADYSLRMEPSDALRALADCS
ncbi:MAG: peroxiredoxin-like family protein [Halieaceae bacterium]